jgi:ATP sulfurylase
VKNLGKKVYVATNLLESMITDPGPTRAEVNDIYNTLEDGVNGLVLAAETAIGRYPIQCVEMINKVIRTFEKKKKGELVKVSDINDAVSPHGGLLVNLIASDDEIDEAKKLNTIEVSDFDLMDIEQMATGTYSPLRGFMSQDELSSVLDNMSLPSGVIWTMPLILQVDEERAREFVQGDKVSLCSNAGIIHGTISVNDIYKLEKEDLCKKWFGTNDRTHPGVERIMSLGDYAIGGEVRLIKKQDKYKSDYYFTPSQTRVLFRKRGWGRVVGFHSRNVIHRAHEFIQLKALELANADGLYISPVVGPKKTGDFLIDPIMKSYQVMNEQGFYPPGKTVLGSFLTYSRYCGPREAIFTALCRKNMGCSHFIIGRDHTGVGNFYGRDDNKNLFEKLGDLGITPIFFDEVAYSKESECYEIVDDNKNYERISGTQVREQLSRSEALPPWFIRQDIQKMLIDKINRGEDLFWS